MNNKKNVQYSIGISVTTWKTLAAVTENRSSEYHAGHEAIYLFRPFYETVWQVVCRVQVHLASTQLLSSVFVFLVSLLTGQIDDLWKTWMKECQKQTEQQTGDTHFHHAVFAQTDYVQEHKCAG
jgi:hypothetical protein